jgi:putative SOS response-associated peptidase YedK
MCGRLSQHREAQQYFSQLPVSPLASPGYRQSYNVGPGTQPMHLQQTEDELVARTARWGYQHGAKRMYINARVETAAKSGYWRPLWENGRIIVPADGWFEWTGEKGDRQPWFIHREGYEPLWLAAILGDDGFAIVTSSADRGLLDIHDRRPVVLDLDAALAWMAPDTTADIALALTAEYSLPESAFKWHPVTRAMGNVRYQKDDAVRPVALHE